MRLDPWSWHDEYLTLLHAPLNIKDRFMVSEERHQEIVEEEGGALSSPCFAIFRSILPRRSIYHPKTGFRLRPLPLSPRL